jgi:hypothetical protein
MYLQFPLQSMAGETGDGTHNEIEVVRDFGVSRKAEVINLVNAEIVHVES